MDTRGEVSRDVIKTYIDSWDTVTAAYVNYSLLRSMSFCLMLTHKAVQFIFSNTTYVNNFSVKFVIKLGIVVNSVACI